MATVTKTLTLEMLYQYLLLAPKYNNEYKRLSFVASDIPPAMADQLAQELFESFKDSRGNNTPFGKYLEAWANESVVAIEAAIEETRSNIRLTETGLFRVTEAGETRSLE